jgi:hypothetical protein
VLLKPVSPDDSMALDSDSTVLMRLSLSRWGFPYLQGIFKYHKCKGRGPFSVELSRDGARAIVTPLLECLSKREDIVPHGVLKDTVVKNRGAHLLLTMRHALLSCLRRIKTCLRSYER